jgi:hypothetical protein
MDHLALVKVRQDRSILPIVENDEFLIPCCSEVKENGITNTRRILE